MRHESATPGQAPDESVSAHAAWLIVLAAARNAAALERAGAPASFGLCENGTLRPLAIDDPWAVIGWRPGAGWEALGAIDASMQGVLDLYLPICSATPGRPITVGHLGQSLDGFIATHTGDSHFVTGHANIVHLHRMRALCDAIVVGAGTVAADDPQLTTRHVEGPSPLRVILDPGRRLSADYRVFTDDSAPTLYVCSRSLVRAGETRLGYATVMGVDAGAESADLPAVVGALRSRGCGRIFVEGGGVTVSAFLEANLLDRLHMAIAPLLIGDGRPAIRLPARAALSDCLRPRYRVFRMGGDVLFDCELRYGGDSPEEQAGRPGVTRII